MLGELVTTQLGALEIDVPALIGAPKAEASDVTESEDCSVVIPDAMTEDGAERTKEDPEVSTAAAKIGLISEPEVIDERMLYELDAKRLFDASMRAFSVELEEKLDFASVAPSTAAPFETLVRWLTRKKMPTPEPSRASRTAFRGFFNFLVVVVLVCLPRMPI